MVYIVACTPGNGLVMNANDLGALLTITNWSFSATAV